MTHCPMQSFATIDSCRLSLGSCMKAVCRICYELLEAHPLRQSQNTSHRGVKGMLLLHKHPRSSSPTRIYDVHRDIDLCTQ